MGWLNRTSSLPSSAFRYCSDKAQYFGLEFSLQSLLFPNKKTDSPLRFKNKIKVKLPPQNYQYL